MSSEDANDGFECTLYWVRVYPEAVQGCVPGYALLFGTETRALDAWRRIAGRHLNRSSTSHFEFENANDRTTLRIAVDSDEERLEILIDAITREQLERFLANAEQVLYHVIFFGYLDEGSCPILLDPSEHHLFRSSVVVDGIERMGGNEVPIPWLSVLKKEPMIVLGDE